VPAAPDRTERVLVAVDERRVLDEPFLSAAGAAIVEFELGSRADRVADVDHLGRLDHTGRRELDALADAQPEPGVEQPHAVAEKHRGDVQLELIQQPGRQDLTQ